MSTSLLDEIITSSATETTNLSNLLRKVLILGVRTRHNPTSNWARKELNGYLHSDPIPTYRGPLPAHVQGIWSGPRFSRVTNEISYQPFESKVENHALFNFEFRQPVKHLESVVEGDHDPYQYWPAHAIDEYRRLSSLGKAVNYEFMWLDRAKKIIDRPSVEAILDQVRTSVLELALELQAAEPEAGQASGPTIQNSEVNQIMENHYHQTFNGQNININQGSLNTQNIEQAGSQQNLNIDFISNSIQDKLGVSQEDALKGAEALKQDGWRVGENAKNWAAKLMEVSVTAGLNFTIPQILEGLSSIAGIAT